DQRRRAGAPPGGRLQRCEHAAGLVGARPGRVGRARRSLSGARQGGDEDMAMKKTIIRAGLETLYFSGAYQMMRPFVAGVGAILTLHHVRPPRSEQFQPNRLLEITPQFFDQVLIDLRGSEFDLVSLDEMHRRLVDGD